MMTQLTRDRERAHPKLAHVAKRHRRAGRGRHDGEPCGCRRGEGIVRRPAGGATPSALETLTLALRFPARPPVPPRSGASEVGLPVRSRGGERAPARLSEREDHTNALGPTGNEPLAGRRDQTFVDEIGEVRTVRPLRQQPRLGYPAIAGRGSDQLQNEAARSGLGHALEYQTAGASGKARLRGSGRCKNL
jgi:hypothetical protein